MPLNRLFIYPLIFLLVLAIPLAGLAQPDYIIPLNKPAKFKNRTLRSEKSDRRKFTISRRVYQGMVTHYNYYYNANLKIDNIIAKAKLAHRDDFTELLPFYNYSPAATAADSAELDSIIYKASAGIVLHDLRNSYIDNLYLLAGRAFFYWQKFDSAYRIFQFVNYRFFPKGKDEYTIVVGGNKRSTKGELNISSKEKKGIFRKVFSKPPSRNDALLWIARTYAEDSLLAESAALCHLLRRDKFFPKRLHRSLDEVLAYVYYRQNRWDSTAFYLQKALPNASDKTDLARWEYLLAQLFTKLGKQEEAAAYYAKSKKHTPDPVLHIHARIYEAQIVKNSKGNDMEATYDELIKLSRKERFDGFEDVLYYAAAGMALERKDSTKAISLLQKSAKYNTENAELKNKTFYKLAELYFKQKKYPLASAAYDSLNLQEPQMAGLANQIESRKQILKELVTQTGIVQREDSLQRIAMMNEKDRFLLLKKLLKSLRKQRGIKDKDSDSDYTPMLTSNTAAQDAGLFMQTAANNSGWYFSNNSQKSKGFTEFKARWGKRPNVDNWRRQSAVDAMSTQQQFMPGNPGGIDGDVDRVSLTNLSGVTLPALDEQELSIQSLESDLPLTDTLLSQSNKKIEEALFQQAWIYKNKLEDHPMSIQLLEEILRRFPNSEKEEEVLADLVYNYKKIKNPMQSSRYLSMLNDKYPESEKTIRLNSKAKPIPTANKNQTYEEIYRLFQSGDYTRAAAAKKKADSIHGNKYWTPQLLYIEALSQVKQQNDSLALSTLTYIETNFPGNEMADKVTTLKNVITRRNEIESYLTNTAIIKDEEKKLTTPYEESPELKLLSEPYKVKANTGPSVAKLPPQIIRLEKPRAGIEIISHLTELKRIVPGLSIAKRAGTDSIRIKPMKQEFVDMVYIYNAGEPHYVLTIFEEIDQVYRSEAKIAFERYNNKVRGSEDISIQLYEPNEANSWLEIGPFPALASSLGYYDEVAANIKSIIPWLATEKYQLMIISERNMETLKSRKDISEYLLFIRQYIKGKF